MARSAQTAKIGREARQKLSTILRDVMLTASDAVERSTPVDTGHAMSNWVLSTGRPYEGIDGSRENVSFAAQAAGKKALDNYDIGKHGKIYLRNNVLYVQYLDQGWSQQAPPGFVTKALLAGVSAAPHGQKTRTRAMLKSMAKQAYRKGI